MSGPDDLIKVSIAGWVDDYQPGFVECRFDDRFGTTWRLLVKVPYVTTAELGRDSCYPQPGELPCHVTSRGHDASGRGVVWIETDWPSSVAPIEGTTRFEVFEEQMAKECFDDGRGRDGSR
ncbi:hypothetical protein [Labrys wisconsinensis]|uniref:Uncharacterized protein n=1 Tax=Labrys wisconsinensis TaxID=425677 RepID=A0ABU0J6W6_9HYPH|nr:hypothetical protein [Labrys wisconsinensis]MDQ0468932.1 hypothetical protein [Labrys wisconsinensis]